MSLFVARRLAGVAIVAFAVGACSPQSSSAAAPQTDSPAAVAATAQPPTSVQPVGTLNGRMLPDFATLVEQVGPAVVNVSVVEKAHRVARGRDDARDDQVEEFFRRFGLPSPRGGNEDTPQRQGEGSGFIVSGDGYILTNAHVVADADEVTVRMTDRREYSAKVIGVDKRTDVAVIKIEGKDLPVVRLGDPSKLRPGEWVLAIGSPFTFENSVTAGIVSATGRAMPGEDLVPFIQTDVAVNPGNSGGPLLNAAGQVVGVNSQIYSRSGGYMGLSFAIPADVAANVAQQLKTNGKVSHGRLGIGIQGLNQSLAQSFNLPDSNGALVGTVEKDSPADKAGFQPGDVIRKVDNVAVADSTDVTSRIGNMAPGTKVSVEVWREGKPVTLSATIGTFDDTEKVAKANKSAQGQGKLGVAVRPLTQDEKAEIGHDGLVVENATGPAARAGIQPGDVIVSVGSAKVTTLEQLKRQVDKAGDHVALLIERNGQKIFVPVRIG